MGITLSAPGYKLLFSSAPHSYSGFCSSVLHFPSGDAEQLNTLMHTTKDNAKVLSFSPLNYTLSPPQSGSAVLM